ncbi:MAG: JAB domain-containing protein [candidate division WOR-3 bacterium]
MLLDNKNEPIDNIEINKDSMTATVFVPKEIVKEALLKSASSIILVHNHPLGKTTPSQVDIEMTERIIQACNYVGIKVLDHIIIGKNFDHFYSFAKEGKIK